VPPEQNVFKQMERYTPLSRYLSQKTGLDVHLKVFASYGKLVDSFISSRIDGAFFGSLSYVLVRDWADLSALAQPESVVGSTTYHGLLFVRKENGIKDTRHMKGKRFAFVDPTTVAGFLLPLVYLRSHNINNYKTYLGEVYFAGTHETAIRDVLEGKADVGAAKNSVYWRLAKSDPRIRNELKILTRSPDVPEGPLTFRKNLDADTRQAVFDALLRMNEDPMGVIVLENLGLRRFIAAPDAEYNVVVSYLRQAGFSAKEFRSQVKR
jgi:phosphonate transport system substrate-binding protein